MRNWFPIQKWCLPVDVCESKMPVLKLSVNCTSGQNHWHHLVWTCWEFWFGSTSWLLGSFQQEQLLCCWKGKQYYFVLPSAALLQTNNTYSQLYLKRFHPRDQSYCPLYRGVRLRESSCNLIPKPPLFMITWRTGCISFSCPNGTQDSSCELWMFVN